MSANRYRGEIEAELGGRVRKLKLTLGALAEIEAELGEEDLSALLSRFSDGRIAARDCAVVLTAGLRAAGEPVHADEVAGFGPEAVGVVAQLFAAGFGS